MGQCSASEGWPARGTSCISAPSAVSGAGLVSSKRPPSIPNGRGQAARPVACDRTPSKRRSRSASFAARTAGARLGMQLLHIGRKGSVTAAWEHQKAIPFEGGGSVPSGPRRSRTPGARCQRRWTSPRFARSRRTISRRRRAPRASTSSSSRSMVRTVTCLHNFLSPLTNRRNDGYGGSSKTACACRWRCSRRCARHGPRTSRVGVRNSAIDWVEGGWRIDGERALAGTLRTLGCDYITASSGGAVPEQKIDVRPGYQVPSPSASAARPACRPSPSV